MDHTPKYGYGFRTPYRFRTQSCNDGIRIKFQIWVRNTVRVRKNFEIKVRIRNGYGLILSNIVRLRVRVRVRIGLSLGYGNLNSLDKISKFKIYTTLVFLSIYLLIYERKNMKSTTRNENHCRNETQRTCYEVG